VSIPAQPGDVLGLYSDNAGTANSACTFSGGESYLFSATNQGDGASAPFTSTGSGLLNVSAVVELTPPPPGQHALSVQVAGQGSGTVQSSPAGIEACSSSCSHAYTDGTKVTLTATPGAYSTFSGWSGGGCSGTANCQVSIAAETSVTATFAAVSYGSGDYGYGTGYGAGSGSGSGAGAGGAVGQAAAGPKKCKRKRAGQKKPHKAACAKRTKLVTKAARNAGLGETILTTVKGRTLYSLSAEGGKTFICTGECLSIWIPLIVPSNVKPVGPVKLGTVKRPEGGTQVTYRGRPLYAFAGDTGPGQTNGQGIKDVGIWGAVPVPPPQR
jgi:predicted lipoprotein with Yx(FWY)xxD motif